MKLEYLINAEAISTDGANKGTISELARILLTVKQKPAATREIRELYDISNRWRKISRAALISAYLSWFSPLLIREFNAGTIAFFTSVVVTYFVSRVYSKYDHRAEIHRQVLAALDANNAAGRELR